MRLFERERLRLRDLDRLRDEDELEVCESDERDLDRECLRLCESGDERLRRGDTDRERERFFNLFSLILVF